MNRRKTAAAIRKAVRSYYGHPIALAVGVHRKAGSRLATVDQFAFVSNACHDDIISLEAALGMLPEPVRCSVMDGYVYTKGFSDFDGELETNIDIWFKDGRFIGVVDSVGNKNYVREFAEFLDMPQDRLRALANNAHAWQK